MAKVKSDRDLVDSGIKALVDAVGYSGAARFLRHFSKGKGDYLVIQKKIFKGMDLEKSTKKQKIITSPVRHSRTSFLRLARLSSFRCFENSRNVKVPPGTRTNRFCPGKRYERGSSPVHDHDPRIRFFPFLSFIPILHPSRISPCSPSPLRVKSPRGGI